MSDFDNWRAERERLLTAVGPATRARVTDAIDLAAALAQKRRLREAANALEDARQGIVCANVFRSWEEGICCFSNLIELTRNMSAEKTVPAEFQRFLSAIPSTRCDDGMNRLQRMFWYGSPATLPSGTVRTVRGGSSQSSKRVPLAIFIVVFIVIAVGAYLGLR